MRSRNVWSKESRNFYLIIWYQTLKSCWRCTLNMIFYPCTYLNWFSMKFDFRQSIFCLLWRNKIQIYPWFKSKKKEGKKSIICKITWRSNYFYDKYTVEGCLFWTFFSFLFWGVWTVVLCTVQNWGYFDILHNLI